MSPIEVAKDLENQINNLEMVIINKKLGTKSNEYLIMNTLTHKYLSITKPLIKYPSTNTHQNLY